MTKAKVDLIAGLTFKLTADGTAVQESTDPNSVVKGFSDDVEQIAQQIFEAMRFSAGSLQQVNEPQPPEWVPKGNSFMQDHAREVARAILARWGHQPAPPTEKEPEFPTTQELKTFACEWWRTFGLVKNKATCTWVLDQVDPEHFADFARDALARWGRQPAPLEADGPAVPKSREPASVTGQPSNRTRRVCIWSPTQMAECGGPCWEARDPSACDCGALWMDVPEGREPASVAGEPSDAEVLAARPLLERVAAMGDCIGANTVGEIMAISDRAAAWLTANPPGNPIAIELRGCPIPGACSCVQPAPPTEKEVAVLLRELRDAAFDLDGSDPAKAMLTNTADLLERRPPTPVPAVIETIYEFCVYDENYIDQAGGTAPTYAQALSEGQRYLAQYLQDGTHTLELRRIELLPLPQGEPHP